MGFRLWALLEQDLRFVACDLCGFRAWGFIAQGSGFTSTLLLMPRIAEAWNVESGFGVQYLGSGFGCRSLVAEVLGLGFEV